MLSSGIYSTGWGFASLRAFSSRDGSYPAPFEFAFSLAQDLQGRDQFGELPRIQKIRWIAGPASTPPLFDGEGLVKKEATRSERLDQSRKERTMEVVDTDDDFERGFGKLDSVGLEIEDFGAKRDSDLLCSRPESRDALCIVVDGQDVVVGRRQQQRMPPTATGKVQNGCPWRQQICAFEKPGARTLRAAGSAGVKLARASPRGHAAHHVEYIKKASSSEELRCCHTADAVLAEDQQGCFAVQKRGESGCQEIQRQECCPGNMPKGTILFDGSHVEHVDGTLTDHFGCLEGSHVSVGIATHGAFLYEVYIASSGRMRSSRSCNRSLEKLWN